MSDRREEERMVEGGNRNDSEARENKGKQEKRGDPHTEIVRNTSKIVGGTDVGFLNPDFTVDGAVSCGIDGTGNTQQVYE